MLEGWTARRHQRRLAPGKAAPRRCSAEVQRCWKKPSRPVRRSARWHLLLQGGLPIMVMALVTASRVSGATSQQDEQVAAAGMRIKGADEPNKP